MQTETSSAAALLAAAAAALVWANIDGTSYDATWSTLLSFRVGDHGLSLTLRGWVNSGLMTFFFFVVGLEARREAEMGEMRERRRVALPVLAGIGGMVVPVGIYLAINGGGPAAGGWGAAMSTDTAFALAVLTLVGPRFADRLRAFVLTVVVVDDIVALLVIASVYSGDIDVGYLLLGLALFVGVLALRALRVRGGLVYFLLGAGTWVAMLHSGVDPLVVGLALGLLVYAYPASRTELERASREFRLFREQPTPELARRARAGLESAISPNERLARMWHPWTGYLIVPLFALANIGIPLNPHFLAEAFTSPVTLGIALGYLLGKPAGITLAAGAVTVMTRGRMRPPVGWGAVLGTGSAAGVGFTVSLLIASLAFHGADLSHAKVGVLTAAIASAGLSAGVFRLIDVLPPRVKTLMLLGTSSALVDLADPVDAEHDHVRGPLDAPVTLVEYGDLECPYCGRAEPVVRELLADLTDITYVWRHLPLDDVHPHARLAAEATEAAHAQGAFWPMHDRLLEHQEALTFDDLVRHAEELGLHVERFAAELAQRAYAQRVTSDVDSAELSGVSGTPTFFINGHRHRGAFDWESLRAAVLAAGGRVRFAP